MNSDRFSIIVGAGDVENCVVKAPLALGDRASNVAHGEELPLSPGILQLDVVRDPENRHQIRYVAATRIPPIVTIGCTYVVDRSPEVCSVAARYHSCKVSKAAKV